MVLLSYLTKIFEFRFVNLVDENHDDIENIWEQVKQVRKKFLTNNYDPECDGNANTIVEDDIKKIFNLVDLSSDTRQLVASLFGFYSLINSVVKIILIS